MITNDRKDTPILIIEDEETIAELYKQVLTDAGYTNIHISHNGEDGIDIFEKHHIPILIIDYNLPGMSGIETLAKINRSYPPTQSLIITGKHDTDIIKSALREGACDFFNKPLDMSLFKHAVGRCVEQHVLITENKRQHDKLEESNRYLEDVVDARTKSLRKINIELNSIIYKTVEALTKAVEIKDPYTTGHQDRVTMIAVEIAKEIGLSEWQLENIRLAGPIHDIGKIYVPPDFLTKPTKLSNEEFDIIRQHSIKGFEIIQDIPFHADIANIVKQHHERMNGRGYPDKLKGDEILIEARVIAVADTIEAMSANRPYRLSKGIDAAIEAIIYSRDNGELWDKAVNGCLTVLKRHNNDIESLLFNSQLLLINSPAYADPDTDKLIRIDKVNCWDFKFCNRRDKCPAYPDHGDCCSTVIGTLCSDCNVDVQQSMLHKLIHCSTCDFHSSPYYDKIKSKQYLHDYIDKEES